MSLTNLPKDLVESSIWSATSSSLWPASTFSLRRNLQRFPFPMKQTASQSEIVKNQILKSIGQTPSLSEGIFLDFSKLTPGEKEFLFEYAFFRPERFEDKPHQGVFIDLKNHLFLFINIDDHLIIHVVDAQNLWHESWNKVAEIEKEFSKSLDFAYSPRFGYLTSNLEHCGTAVTIKCYLQLTALIEESKSDNPLLIEEKDEVKLSPLSMSLEEKIESDIFIVENKFSLGFQEQLLLKQVYTKVNKLIHEEKNLRLKIASSESSDLKDLVARCFGILLHSYKLDEQESLNALSMIKFGIDLGWVEGLEDHQINSLIFHTSKGLFFSEDQTPLESNLAHQRALYIHDHLKKASLKI